MGRKNEDGPKSAIQKKFKREKIKTKNRNIQERENILTDTFGLEEMFKKNDIKILNIHDLRIDLSNQNITKQPFLFKSKIDPNGKLVQTLMSFQDIEAFDKYLGAIDEHYDGGSTIVHETDIFHETYRKIPNEVK